MGVEDRTFLHSFSYVELTLSRTGGGIEIVKAGQSIRFLR